MFQYVMLVYELLQALESVISMRRQQPNEFIKVLFITHTHLALNSTIFPQKGYELQRVIRKYVYSIGISV